MNRYRPVIGLEVHVELSTQSKMFCGCPANHFAQKPNTQVCPVCLGLPGALPWPNQKAIENTILFGLALDCQIAKFSKFDRKHYFYPDLPKGYQISQYDLPVCLSGHWAAPDGDVIRIRRVHLEEDTAKLVHQTVNGKKVSLVDFNRSGVPLMEMVTEPDFDGVDEVVDFLKEIQKIVRSLGISSADMEKGSMRLEANISLAPQNGPKDQLPDYKVELKNINSFRFLKKALQAEVARQEKLLESGETPSQETRGYDQEKNTTFSQRTKEEAQDYRYFPEPDIPPLVLTDRQIEKLRAKLPELPREKRARYKKEFDLPEDYINVLTQDLETQDYFEKAVEYARDLEIPVKQIASVMVNQQMHQDIADPAQLVQKLYEISKKEYLGEEEVGQAVDKVLSQQTEAVAKYKSGKTAVLGYLLGQVQRELSGRADPQAVSRILRDRLG